MGLRPSDAGLRINGEIEMEMKSEKVGSKKLIAAFAVLLLACAAMVAIGYAYTALYEDVHVDSGEVDVKYLFINDEDGVIAAYDGEDIQLTYDTYTVATYNETTGAFVADKTLYVAHEDEVAVLYPIDVFTVDSNVDITDDITVCVYAGAAFTLPDDFDELPAAETVKIVISTAELDDAEDVDETADTQGVAVFDDDDTILYADAASVTLSGNTAGTGATIYVYALVIIDESESADTVEYVDYTKETVEASATFPDGTTVDEFMEDEPAYALPGLTLRYAATVTES